MVNNSKCHVPFCNHVQKKNKDCTYSVFPANLDQCRSWLKVVGVEDLLYLQPAQLNRIRRVCGCHFTDDQFVNKNRKRLKRSAVPSLVDSRVCPLDDALMNNFPLPPSYVPLTRHLVRYNGPKGKTVANAATSDNKTAGTVVNSATPNAATIIVSPITSGAIGSKNSEKTEMKIYYVLHNSPAMKIVAPMPPSNPGHPLNFSDGMPTKSIIGQPYQASDKSVVNDATSCYKKTSETVVNSAIPAAATIIVSPITSGAISSENTKKTEPRIYSVLPDSPAMKIVAPMPPSDQGHPLNFADGMPTKCMTGQRYQASDKSVANGATSCYKKTAETVVNSAIPETATIIVSPITSGAISSENTKKTEPRIYSVLPDSPAMKIVAPMPPSDQGHLLNFANGMPTKCMTGQRYQVSDKSVANGATSCYKKTAEIVVNSAIPKAATIIVSQTTSGDISSKNSEKRETRIYSILPDSPAMEIVAPMPPTDPGHPLNFVDRMPTKSTTRRRYRASAAVQRITAKKQMELFGLGTDPITPREKKLLSIIRKQQATITEITEKIRNRESAIKQLTSDKNFTNLINDISSPMLRQLVVADLKNGSRSSNGRRWSDDEKDTAISLYKQGPKAYSFLQRIISLPTKQTLLRLMHDKSMKTGSMKTGVIVES